MNYYNEYDKKTAMWLRELIKSGLIPDGIVDDRSIVEVKPDDLRGYTQCHFFAGIGGWSVALQLAGWPADKPVWTGSCPCQPFSAAGKGLAQADERHLWPVFYNLIKECRPITCFGEQVASAIGKGWLDGISADLESEDYACGATVLGAHSVGAPHIRQRLYWMADSCGNGRNQAGQYQPKESGDGAFRDGIASGMGDTNSPGLSEQRKPISISAQQLASELRGTLWNAFDLLPCRDGKSRRIESGTFPLAHGVSGRVGLLRGYGNAIVPQCAAAFIQAYLDCRD